MGPPSPPWSRAASVVAFGGFFFGAVGARTLVDVADGRAWVDGCRYLDLGWRWVDVMATGRSGSLDSASWRGIGDASLFRGGVR